jgi:hypothetical protein
MGGNLYVHERTYVLVGLDLFKHLPESCLDLLAKDSHVFSLR